MEHDMDAMNELWRRVAPRVGYEEFAKPAPKDMPIPAGFPHEAWVAGGNGVIIKETANIPHAGINVWDQVLDARKGSLPVCFGNASPEIVETLRFLYAHEARETALYEQLTYGNRRNKLCRKLCERQKKLVRRLDTVLYLLSGTRYGAHPVKPDMNGNTLRERYHAMALSAAGYKELANKTNDNCLRDLFMDTAMKKAEGAELLLEHIEQESV